MQRPNHCCKRYYNTPSTPHQNFLSPKKLLELLNFHRLFFLPQGLPGKILTSKVKVASQKFSSQLFLYDIRTGASSVTDLPTRGSTRVFGTLGRAASRRAAGERRVPRDTELTRRYLERPIKLSSKSLPVVAHLARYRPQIKLGV